MFQFRGGSIAEVAADDTDFERQWVRLGALGPQLKIKSIELSDDHVAPGQEVKTLPMLNVGGETNSQFKVDHAGDANVPFDTLLNLLKNSTIPVSVNWNAKEGVEELSKVDPEDVIVS